LVTGAIAALLLAGLGEVTNAWGGVTYPIDASAGTGGTISPNNRIYVAPGADQVFQIIPNACYEVADVMVDGSSIGPTTFYTFQDVQGPHTIEASFSLIQFKIDASAGTGGSISPSGSSVADCGSSLSFTITAEDCYSIADVQIDGISQGAIRSIRSAASTRITRSRRASHPRARSTSAPTRAETARSRRAAPSPRSAATTSRSRSRRTRAG
jgi:hypothetical protein